MTTKKREPVHKVVRSAKVQLKRRLAAALAALGAVSLSTGCNFELLQVSDARSLLLPVSNNTTSPVAASLYTTPTPKPTPLPTFTPTPSPTLSPTPAPTSTPTVPPSPTPWPTATPWPTPEPWSPVAFAPPTLASVPVAPSTGPAVVTGSAPVGYSPPHDVDVFGNVVLRWDYPGLLAEDEFFDIKIKPAGSDNSAFVDWTKTKTYELRPWSGWSPGLYTWQIGIIKGYLEGETKHFIADTGRDSQPFIIKWQAAGSGDDSSGNNGGGGGGTSGGS